MTHETITFENCAITDEVYQLDQKLAGEAIIWNVTRIRRDAERGLFGPTIRRPMTTLPVPTPAHTANIDWRKVLDFAKRPGVLAIPILCLDCGEHRHVVDGNCRIAARQLAGLADFETFIVPDEIEYRYRVVVLIDGKPARVDLDAI